MFHTIRNGSMASSTGGHSGAPSKTSWPSSSRSEAVFVTASTQHGSTEASVGGPGIRCGSRTMQPLTELAEPPLKAGPTFLFKYLPSSTLTPGFDGPVSLVRQQTDLEYLRFEMGMGTIAFEESPHEPWSEIRCVQVLAAYSFTANTTMQPGTIVGEADPEAFLPYSFDRTDWGFAS